MARLLAPAALLAAVIAVLVVVTGTGDDEPSAPPRPAATTADPAPTVEGDEDEEAQTPAPAETTGTTATAPASGETYTIQPGDTLAGIASANDTTVEALREANPDIDPSALRVGDELQLGGG